jgi:hypothetical protein
MKLSAKELDSQNEIRIDRWIDLHSEEALAIDDNREFTIKCLRLGMREPAFLFTDSRGFLWGQGSEPGRYYPFHLEHGNKLIGLKLSTKASN